jgi:hypothetical protein
VSVSEPRLYAAPIQNPSHRIIYRSVTIGVDKFQAHILKAAIDDEVSIKIRRVGD